MSDFTDTVRDIERLKARIAELEKRLDGEPEADLGDYPPMPRNYEVCDNCGNVRNLRHHCDLEKRLDTLLMALGAISNEANWVRKLGLVAHRNAMERIRKIIMDTTRGK